MAAQNIVDLPPHNPGMAEIHRRLTNAFRVHWKTHPGAAPQKIVLNQKQADDLELTQLYGGASLPGFTHKKGKFFDRPWRYQPRRLASWWPMTARKCRWLTTTRCPRPGNSCAHVRGVENTREAWNDKLRIYVVAR